MATVVSVQKTTQKKFEKQNFLLEMNENDKEVNHKIIKRMNKRINYLKNPKFRENKRPVMFSDLIYKQELINEVNNKASSFRAIPSTVIFRDYMINNIYEIELKLINVSNILKRVKYMPPSK